MTWVSNLFAFIKTRSWACWLLLWNLGNFPYLSRPEEVNMHIEVHLRRIAELESAPIDIPSSIGGDVDSTGGVTNKDFVKTHVVPVEEKKEEKSESDSDDDFI